MEALKGLLMLGLFVGCILGLFAGAYAGSGIAAIALGILLFPLLGD